MATVVSLYHSALERNLKLFRWGSAFSGLIFIIPIWVLFERGLLSFGQMALLEAVGMALTVLLELPTGALADVFGRKASTGWGFGLQAIGAIIEGTATTPVQFIIGFGLAAVGGAFVSGAEEALLYDSLKDLDRSQDFQKEMSACGLWFQIGMAGAILTGGYLYHWWIGLPYIAYGFGLAAAASIFFTMQEPHSDSEKFTWRGYWTQTVKGLQEITRTRMVLAVSLFYVIVGGITWSGQLFFNQVYAVSLGFTDIQLSWVFGAVRIINSIIIFRLSKLGERFGKRHALVFFPTIMLLAYLPAFWLTDKWLAIPSLMLATLAGSARFTVLGQYCHDEFSSRNRATAMSTLSMGVSLWFVVTVGIGGKIVDLTSAGTMYSLLGMLTLIFVVPLAWLIRRRHPVPPVLPVTTTNG